MNDVTRRMFIAGGAGAVMMLAVGGVAKYAFGDAPLVRPPGGQDEDHFIATCIKCDRCRGVCPLDCIGVANMNDGLLNARTPKLDYHLGYCDFCNLCIENCPTGALHSFNPDEEWIAPAIIDIRLCIAYQPEGVGCGKCIEGCPFDAITSDAQGRPVVESEKCNGCGYCEYICPSNSYRVFSGIRKRAITVEPGNGVRSATGAGGGAS
ncbi:MAG: 4Fe-4S dicluster domain-containing protein [Coriobacteriales bacterium]|nr:4Fe-4S dicluster domain-containing protein [Coriobacteriales bacterium]